MRHDTTGRRALAWAAAAILLALAPAPAERGGDRMGLDTDHGDQVARRVFPPRLVIAFQHEIGLGEDQRQALIREMQATQSDLVPLQVELGETGRRLARALEEPVIDEGLALELTDRMLGLEGRVKRRHMTMMIRIKNLLSPEQQRALERLRRERGGGR